MASELPDELWVQILSINRHASHELYSFCLINHQLRRIVTPTLYAEVTQFASPRALLAFLESVSQNPQLAHLVRKLDLEVLIPTPVHADDRLLECMQAALRAMANLTSLAVPGGYPSRVLAGATFRLERLSCAFDCDPALEAFWRTQTALAELHIFGYPRAPACRCRGDPAVLPRLAVLRANAAWLAQLAPARPSLRTIEALDAAQWLPVHCPPHTLGGVNMLILPADGMAANFLPLSRLPIRLDALIVTNLSLEQPSRLLQTFSDSRVLKPMHLGLQLPMVLSRTLLLDTTISMFLKSAPQNLKSLNLTYIYEAVEYAEQWSRHPEQPGSWLSRGRHMKSSWFEFFRGQRLHVYAPQHGLHMLVLTVFRTLSSEKAESGSWRRGGRGRTSPSAPIQEFIRGYRATESHASVFGWLKWRLSSTPRGGITIDSTSAAPPAAFLYPQPSVYKSKDTLNETVGSPEKEKPGAVATRRRSVSSQTSMSTNVPGVEPPSYKEAMNN
ncbi:hypothetical protein BKA62DRAFT_827914 [Auriculariales sp. MPI-PUGE-AT-0066]|nr:hypothetical protein BKA62DRAFT_827914 [Auriculariales sp. MPI-PUGE-AT-0066]